MTENPQEQSVASRTFARDGYLISRGMCDRATTVALRRTALSHLSPVWGPVEYESDVGYPGAPDSREDAGGHTVRRLLNASSRDPVFREWATGALVAAQLAALFGRDDVFLSQCHHNCVMTKHPGYSSATLWHQDIRYWSFDQPDLISVWLALGNETLDNGALKVIPGSHTLDLDRGRFDSKLFLRPEIDANRRLIDAAEPVLLEEGDVLFFHCRLFHAAGMNLTDEIKLSPVFTYHTGANMPIPNTRSAQLPGVRVPFDLESPEV